MRTGNDEAFMPGNCPALRKGEEPFVGMSRGFVVRPSDIEVDIESLNAKGDAVDKIDPDRVNTTSYIYVRLDPVQDIHAYVMKKTYRDTDPEVVLPDLMDDDPDVEEHVGGLVCSRLKDCLGPVEFGGEAVCQGLHPEEVLADLRRWYYVD